MLRSGIAVVAILAGIGLWWGFAEGPLRDPRDALQDFYDAQDRAEDQLCDPLILNGSRVVPLVLAEIPDKEMPLRRYAISFLGNGGYKPAIPVLEEILADEAEVYYFRADALQAIYSIDRQHGERLALDHVDGEGLLGQFAGQVAKGEEPKIYKRSYWEAFWHVHH